MANTSVNQLVIKVAAYHAIEAHLMNCTVNVVLMLFIHQFHAEPNGQPVIGHALANILAIMKLPIIVNLRRFFSSDWECFNTKTNALLFVNRSFTTKLPAMYGFYEEILPRTSRTTKHNPM